MNTEQTTIERLSSLANQVVAIGVMALLALACWELAVWCFDLPAALLPTPRAVLAAAIENAGDLTKGILVTGAAAGLGLVLAITVGGLLSIVFSLSKLLRLALFPYVVFLQTVPIVAIAPLLIIWSGYEFRTVLIVTVIVCLFPIINSVTAGLTSIDHDLDDLFLLYGSGRWQRLVRLQIPSAVPDLLVGAKTSSGLAVIGAIVAEFFVENGSGTPGLGTLMTGWQGQIATAPLIAALFASTLVGLVLFATVHLLSVTALRRWA